MQSRKLEQLVRSGAVRRGRDQHMPADRVITTGWKVLDEQIGGGWPQYALIEILSERRLALSVLLPVLAQLSRQSRWITWITPPETPYAPALAAGGIDLQRVLVIQDVSAEQCLWAMEQSLRSGVCSMVLGWPQRLQPVQVRRLQLAAERGGCMGVIFRPMRDMQQSSVAALRLRVSPVPLGLEVEVLKRPNGWGGGRCCLPLPGGRIQAI